MIRLIKYISLHYISITQVLNGGPEYHQGRHERLLERRQPAHAQVHREPTHHALLARPQPRLQLVELTDQLIVVLMRDKGVPVAKPALPHGYYMKLLIIKNYTPAWASCSRAWSTWAPPSPPSPRRSYAAALPRSS